MMIFSHNSIYLRLCFLLSLVVIIASVNIPLVNAAPPEFNPNQVLCNNDLVDVNSLEQLEIQEILEGAGSDLATYRDPNKENTLASQSIYDVAQEYQINPWLILVKIQTESSTVWGNNRTNLETEVGANGQVFGTLVEWVLFYGWPDNSANIDPTQRGFANQISNFARIIRSDFDDIQDDGIGRNGWEIGKVVEVKDELEDGTSEVTKVMPVNAITTALYIYTPHVYYDKSNLHSIWLRRVGNTGCDDSISNQPGFWEGIKSAWEKFINDIQQRLTTWLNEKKEELQRGFEQWVEEQTDRILRELEIALTSWLEQQCMSCNVSLLLPTIALILRFWVTKTRQI